MATSHQHTTVWCMHECKGLTDYIPRVFEQRQETPWTRDENDGLMNHSLVCLIDLEWDFISKLGYCHVYSLRWGPANVNSIT